MSLPKVGTALAAVLCAALLLLPATALAQTGSTGTTGTSGTPTTSLKHIAVTGKGRNGKHFTGHYTITQFVTRHGKSYALGKLTGKLGNRHISRSNVAIPASIQRSGAASTAAVCPILHLVLGPVNLNLLGLHVTLGGGAAADQPIVLDITAVSGPGNLLGNLLCGVSNLLNGQSLLGSELSGLLNIVQQLLNNPALAGL